MNRRNAVRLSASAARLQEQMERECSDISRIEVPPKIKASRERYRRDEAKFRMDHHDAKKGSPK